MTFRDEATHRRVELLPCDILAHHAQHLIGGAICLRTGGSVSHVGMALPSQFRLLLSEGGTWLDIGAMAFAVRPVPLDVELEQDTPITVLRLLADPPNPHWRWDVSELALWCWGRIGYSEGHMLVNVLPAEAFRIPDLDSLALHPDLMCSEWVSALYRLRAGIDLCPGKDDAWTTPRDIVDAPSLMVVAQRLGIERSDPVHEI